MSETMGGVSRDGALSINLNRSRPPYRKWSRAENDQIAAARIAGKTLREIADEHGANVNQIASKLYVWGLCKQHRPRVEQWDREWRIPARLARQIHHERKSQ